MLPTISDPDSGDTWTISVDNYISSGLYQFTKLQYPFLSFSPSDSSHAGTYPVTLILKDNQGLSSKYSFLLDIIDPLFEEKSNDGIDD